MPDDRVDQATHGSGNRDAASGTGSADHRILGSEAPAETNDGDPIMADDKSDRGARDRSRVAGEQQYEVAYFANRHGLTTEEARRIIAAAGPSRAKADELASRK